MKKTILEVYALAVCFVTIFCFAIFLGIAIYGLIEISNPEFTLNSRAYERHQSNEAFKRYYSKTLEGLTEKEIENRRKLSYEMELKGVKKGSGQAKQLKWLQ